MKKLECRNCGGTWISYRNKNEDINIFNITCHCRFSSNPRVLEERKHIPFGLFYIYEI